ncbi:MAG: hypothetical protein B6242_05335 [Anaerolineaceae bacterium 4572_78]|nr:MAG: hypothetical protein B6242_05335 [Anaerolineaceae bacterium 4572_78]
MKKFAYTIGIIVVVLGIILGGSYLFPMPDPVVSVRAESLFSVDLGGLGKHDVTNSLITSWIVMLVIGVMFYLGTRNMNMVPSGYQNFLEWVIEGIYDLTETIAGAGSLKKFPIFFTIPTTIFIYVIVSNWLGLFPGLPLMGVGICQEHHAETTEHSQLYSESIVHASSGTEEVPSSGGGRSTCAEGEHLVPIIRSPSADLNNTLALALITQVLAQVLGIVALGSWGYFSKFLVIRPHKGLAMAVLDFFVGILEFISEFVKIIAYTFRLFGNIFAGEVTIIILVFFMPILGALPMFAFEVFVGFIQAFIFYILSVAFYTIAIQSHEQEAH